MTSCADHCFHHLVQPPNLSTSNLTQSSPRGVKRSRSPEIHGESLGYDRTDDGMLQAPFGCYHSWKSNTARIAQADLVTLRRSYKTTEARPTTKVEAIRKPSFCNSLYPIFGASTRSDSSTTDPIIAAAISLSRFADEDTHQNRSRESAAHCEGSHDRPAQPRGR
jgi:hypothetical protein